MQSPFAAPAGAAPNVQAAPPGPRCALVQPILRLGHRPPLFECEQAGAGQRYHGGGPDAPFEYGERVWLSNGTANCIDRLQTDHASFGFVHQAQAQRVETAAQ